MATVDKDHKIAFPGTLALVVELNALLVLALGGVCLHVGFCCPVLCLLGLSKVRNIPDHACPCCSMVMSSISSLGKFCLSLFVLSLPVLASSHEKICPCVSCSDSVQPAICSKVLPLVRLGLLLQASRGCNALTHVPLPKVSGTLFSVSICTSRTVSNFLFDM
jgi:hypothetical protein